MFDDTQEQIEKLENLFKSAYISEQEFKTRKNELLGFPSAASASIPTPSYSYSNSYSNDNVQQSNISYNEISSYQQPQQSASTFNNIYSIPMDTNDNNDNDIPILNDDFSTSNTSNKSQYQHTNSYNITNTTTNSNWNNNYRNNNSNNRYRNNNNQIYSKPTATPAPAPAQAVSTTTFASAVFGNKPTSAPSFASAVFSNPPLRPSQPIQQVRSIATASHTYNGREYKFSAYQPNSVLHVDISNWTKERDNYGRPDDPTPDQTNKWKAEQINMAKSVIKTNKNNIKLSDLKYIGGVDISFAKNNKIDACASIVVIEYPSLKVVYESYKMVKLTAPYIAGLLAFREIPHLIPLWNDLKRMAPQFTPQVMVIDGNGINHMRGLGAACHLGVMIDCPTIGVAKQLLVCHGITNEYIQEEFDDQGYDAEIEMRSDSTNELLGFAMKNSDDETVYISPGHKMDASLALEIVKATFNSKPIPEPTFQADKLSRQFLKEHYSKFRS